MFSSPNIRTTIRFQNKCYVSNDGIAHCQSYYEDSLSNKKEVKINPLLEQLKEEAKKLSLPPVKFKYPSLNNSKSTTKTQKKKKKVLLKNKLSQQQQKNVELTPKVEKLMKGELLDNKKKNIEDVRTLEDYKEQIQICVANPGRFRASWTLLVILFGEAELYNYINKNAWNKKELKKFEINENY